MTTWAEPAILPNGFYDAMPRRSDQITADFPGAATPVGSVVRFRGTGGTLLQGKVTGMRVRHADVAGEDGNEWSVPYAAIVEALSRPAVECDLREVEAMALSLMKRAAANGSLSDGWTFGFDLAPTRAGVCRYDQRRINLSVSYCMAATRAEIEDTILHEIAHAIVGPRHNHDAVWKSKAREIGCVGERCHRVQHSTPKWVGECGCGQQWFRQALQRRMVNSRACAKCGGIVHWRRNVGAEVPR